MASVRIRDSWRANVIPAANVVIRSNGGTVVEYDNAVCSDLGRKSTETEAGKREAENVTTKVEKVPTAEAPEPGS